MVNPFSGQDEILHRVCETLHALCPKIPGGLICGWHLTEALTARFTVQQSGLFCRRKRLLQMNEKHQCDCDELLLIFELICKN